METWPIHRTQSQLQHAQVVGDGDGGGRCSCNTHLRPRERPVLPCFPNQTQPNGNPALPSGHLSSPGSCFDPCVFVRIYLALVIPCPPLSSFPAESPTTPDTFVLLGSISLSSLFSPPTLRATSAGTATGGVGGGGGSTRVTSNKNAATCDSGNPSVPSTKLPPVAPVDGGGERLRWRWLLLWCFLLPPVSRRRMHARERGGRTLGLSHQVLT